MIKELRILNLEQMLELYSILKPYLDDKENDLLTFIQEIIKRIKPKEYLQILCILTNSEPKDVANMTSVERLTIVTQGLSINKMLTFSGLVTKLGLI